MVIVIFVLIALSVLGFPLLEILMAGFALVMGAGLVIGAWGWVRDRVRDRLGL